MSLTIEKGHSLWSDAFQRLKKNRAAVLSAVILAIIFFICLVVPFIPNLLQDPNESNLLDRNLKPSVQHWLGTDQLGRDLLARLIFGGRISIAVGIVTTIVAVVIGVVWGAVAGYGSKRMDAILMRTVDILYAMPFLVIVILIGKILQERTEVLTEWAVQLFLSEGASAEDDNRVRTWLEPLCSLVPLFIAIGALSWLTISRIVRAQVQNVKKLEFVEAARSLGISDFRILFRHILPNTVGPIVVYATMTIPSIMLFEATLSFLGLGIKAPNSSWGVLIKEGADIMTVNPSLILFPGVIFALTLQCLNYLGDGLRDALDPKSSKD